MLVTLPKGKQKDLRKACNDLIEKHKPTIRQTASVIGKLVAAFPAVRYRPLHYQHLQRAKERALKLHAGQFGKSMRLPAEAIIGLQWWMANIRLSSRKILLESPSVFLQTDTNGLGWGATNTVRSCGGRWNEQESIILQLYGINYLELLGAQYGLKFLGNNMQHVQIQIQIANTTAVAHINHMGGVKSVSCDRLSNLIWQWCIERDIWVTAVYPPGRYNTVADARS